MSIKSDKWIRRMAEQHGMIEPFEPKQVKTNAEGQRMVSYVRRAMVTTFVVAKNSSFLPTLTARLSTRKTSTRIRLWK